MTPIADALDMFQGEEYMYMGIYTPCVLATVAELKSQQNALGRGDRLQFLISTLLESVAKR